MASDIEFTRRCERALGHEVGRVAGLLRSLPRDPCPDGAVGGWNLVEVAVHLSQVWVAVPGLARVDLSEVEAMVPDRGAGSSVARSIDQLRAVTRTAVAAEPERDPAVLARRIEARARDYLAECALRDPDQHRPWLISDVMVPQPLFTAHLLNETVVHGWDIARAAGRPWRIDAEHAGLVVRGFLLEMLLHGAPILIADPAKLAAAQGRYRFDIRGSGSVRMVLDERGARLDTEPGRPDCRMSLDPVAFLLMAFGRRGPIGTVARGGLVAWGRKPWLGVRLRTALPTP